MVVTWGFIVVTVGFLRLVFHWRPQWYLWASHVKCSLAEAQRILLVVCTGFNNFPHSNILLKQSLCKTLDIELGVKVMKYSHFTYLLE